MPKRVKTKYKAVIAAGYKITAEQAYIIEECHPRYKNFLIYNSPFASDNDCHIIFGVILEEVDNYSIEEINALNLPFKLEQEIIEAAEECDIDIEDGFNYPKSYLMVKESIEEWSR